MRFPPFHFARPPDIVCVFTDVGHLVYIEVFMSTMWLSLHLHKQSLPPGSYVESTSISITRLDMTVIKH